MYACSGLQRLTFLCHAYPYYLRQQSASSFPSCLHSKPPVAVPSPSPSTEFGCEESSSFPSSLPSSSVGPSLEVEDNGKKSGTDEESGKKGAVEGDSSISEDGFQLSSSDGNGDEVIGEDGHESMGDDNEGKGGSAGKGKKEMQTSSPTWEGKKEDKGKKEGPGSALAKDGAASSALGGDDDEGKKDALDDSGKRGDPSSAPVASIDQVTAIGQVDGKKSPAPSSVKPSIGKDSVASSALDDEVDDEADNGGKKKNHDDDYDNGKKEGETGDDTGKKDADYDRKRRLR